MKNLYDAIVLGAGPSGMIAAIALARGGKKVAIAEKLSSVGAKLKATGGGRCNLSNTLVNEEFMVSFGKNGRFMQYALEAFDRFALERFLADIGVQTHAPDGFRIFPHSHSSQTIIDALSEAMSRAGVDIFINTKVLNLELQDDYHVITTQNDKFFSKNTVLATGALGYPALGAEGDGYRLAAALGHTTTKLYPAMMPLLAKESWVANCRADTIAKVEIRVNLKKHSKIKAIGDLIFTKNGIRGPVVLDIAREITPLFDECDEIPLLLNLTNGLNETQIQSALKTKALNTVECTAEDAASAVVALSVARELCILAGATPKESYAKLSGKTKQRLIQLLAKTPLTITGHDGFKNAMITRGGIKLSEIDAKTMQSKLTKGLYFCGEVVDIDGPCGGYNLQWAFSSGYLAGVSIL